MPLAYISLGSNLGDRAGILAQAIDSMRAAGLDVRRLSPIYETAPVGTVAQPLFLNMVAEISIDREMTPEGLMSELLEIEKELGRTREVDKGPRTIDLDLLFFGDVVRDTTFLQLPHPRLHQRRFVLVPLNELNPDLEHPVLRESMKELLHRTSDTSEVKRVAA